MTVPYIFADASQNMPLAELDANFAAVGSTDNIEYNPPFANSTVETVTAKLSQTVSVKDFGAVGNGLADDTAAINEMFSAFTGTSVEFDGLGLTYKITSTISKTLSSNVHWRLKDFNFTSANITEPNTETGVLNFTGDEVITGTSVIWTGTNQIDIENCSFTDSRSTLGTLDGLIINNFHRVSLTGVTATGYSNTGVLVESSNNIYVVNCNMSKNLYAGYREGSNQTVFISGGNYSYNGINAPTYGYGLATSAGDGVNNTNYINVQGVTANFNLRKGIDFHAGADVTIMGCTVIGYGTAGIYAVAESGGKNVYNVTIIGNYVYGYSNALGNSNCIEVGSYGTGAPVTGDFIISNNRLQSSQVANSSAIICDMATSSYVPNSLNINNNTIQNGSSSNAPIIYINQPASLLINEVKINDNILHSNATTYAISSFNVANAIKIDGNQITVNSGTVTQGVYFRDDSSVIVSVDNNQFFGSATYGTGTKIFEDYITQISTTGGSARNNRISSGMLKDVYPTGISQSFNTTYPTSTYTFNRQGSIVYNSSAATGSPKGWQCTVTGSPGTWTSMGNL